MLSQGNHQTLSYEDRAAYVTTLLEAVGATVTRARVRDLVYAWGVFGFCSMIHSVKGLRGAK